MKTEKTHEEIYDLLKVALPKEAIKQHPTKKFLSTIKPPYIIDRLNDVFGIDGWTQKTVMVERVGKMVVVQSWLTIPKYGINLEAYGGNDNEDLGDAYKGAQTDALSKMASFIGIGSDVYKGLHDPNEGNPEPKELEKPKNPWLNEDSDLYKKVVERIHAEGSKIDIGEIKKHYSLSKKVQASLELEIIKRNKNGN